MENSLLIKIQGSAKEFLDEIDKIKKKNKELESVLKNTAKVSAVAFAGFASAIALSTKAFVDYEKALIGVGKTTNISGKSLDDFGKQFQKLSQSIPLSTNELLGIAQAAGQLGVTGEANLLKFTDTIAKLGVATDLSGEQAAVALTRIINVTGESIQDIDKLGSVIVELGNNFAATESEIVKVATEVSRSTAVFNVSSSQAAGLATALKSVGVQAQLGGSAVGRAFREIDASIRSGGTSLENLSRLTGIAADDLQRSFGENSTAVFQKFVEGIGQIERAGGDTTKALAAFNLKGDEILKVLPVLAKNSELVGEALKTASDELKNNTALNEEAEKAYASLGSEFEKTKNSVIQLAVGVGKELAPTIRGILVETRTFVNRLNDIDGTLIRNVATFIKWGAIISGAVAGIAAFAAGVLTVSAGITALGSVLLPAAVTASAFWVALTGPIGLAVAGIAAVTAGVIGLVSSLDEKPPETLDEINEKLDKLNAKRKEAQAGNGKTGAIDRSAIDAIDDEIAALKKLQTEKENLANADFGTGSLLVRPEADSGGLNLGADAFGIDTPATQEIPLSANVQQPDAVEAADTSKAEAAAEREIELVSKKEQAKTEKERQAAEKRAAKAAEDTAKRIAALKAENSELTSVQKAGLEGLTQAERDNNVKKQEIENQFIEARKIQNAEERELAIENVRLKNAEELAAIEEFEAAKRERQAQFREEDAALQEELRALEVEQRELINEEDLEALRAQIMTKREIEQEEANRQLEENIKRRNQFQKDELKFGTAVANVKKVFASEEVATAKEAAGSLVQLTRSKNSQLKGIGKAAARVNAAIATGEGAIKAYSSLAGIPIVGPALGAAAAAAVIAFGVEQQQQISAMQTGGFVAPTNGGARDRVPALLEPNELVVPAGVAPNFVQAAGNPDTQSERVVDQDDAAAGQGGTMEIVVGERAAEFITLEQRDNRALGLI